MKGYPADWKDTICMKCPKKMRLVLTCCFPRYPGGRNFLSAAIWDKGPLS